MPSPMRSSGDFVRETGYLTDAERFGWSFVFEALIPSATKAQIEQRSAETPSNT